MKRRLMEWLVCPACEEGPLHLDVARAAPLHVLTVHADPRILGDEGYQSLPPDTVEILEGTLRCEDCGRSYAITDGIPRMLEDGASAAPVSAQSWIRFEGAQQTWEDAFLDVIRPLTPEGFIGRLMLDAGCGFGRHAFYAARYGAEVLALDVSAEAVAAARRNTEHLSAVHVVQGDIYRPPFRRSTFDLVLCLGVLHHVERPRAAFQTLGYLVRSGGRLCTWTYGPRQGMANLVTRGLRSVTTRLGAEQLHRASQGIALGLRVVSHLPYQVFHHVPVAHAIVTHLPVHEHARWPFDIVVADVYDRLRIPVTSTPTGEEVERWYEEEGFADILVTRRVGNYETFRGTGIRR
jgi:SAM-dependent methyltransferase